jgi:hypothetical protein
MVIGTEPVIPVTVMLFEVTNVAIGTLDWSMNVKGATAAWILVADVTRKKARIIRE